MVWNQRCLSKGTTQIQSAWNRIRRAIYRSKRKEEKGDVENNVQNFTNGTLCQIIQEISSKEKIIRVGHLSLATYMIMSWRNFDKRFYKKSWNGFLSRWDRWIHSTFSPIFWDPNYYFSPIFSFQGSGETFYINLSYILRVIQNFAPNIPSLVRPNVIW